MAVVSGMEAEIISFKRAPSSAFYAHTHIRFTAPEYQKHGSGGHLAAHYPAYRNENISFRRELASGEF